MKLRDKFAPIVYCYVGSGMLTNSYDETAVDYNTEKCEKICDEFTIGFTDWLMIKMSNPNFPAKPTEELLKLYKEEKNL